MTQSTFAKIIGCTLFLLVCSCGEQKGARSVEEIAEEIVILQPDTSLYAALLSTQDDSFNFQIDRSEENIAIDCRDALQNGQFYGSIHEGDKYAIVLDPNSRHAVCVVNLTDLSGQWFYDMHNNRGLTFSAAGALSSINPDEFCFKKWKFHNGKLILYYVNIDEAINKSRDYHTDTTEIERLSGDELVFRFRNETLRCSRRKEAIKIKLKF